MNHYDPSLAPLSETAIPLSRVTSEPRLEPRKRRPQKKASTSAVQTQTKNFVLDTNVLLHDPTCIHRFAEHHVWIPVDVLAELDRFKNEQSERGANARAVHRSLRTAFGEAGACVTTGVPTPGGGSLRLAVYDPQEEAGSGILQRFHRILPDADRVDHRILAAGLSIRSRDPQRPAVLITKDLNMQLKAIAVGLACEDYLNDKVEAKDVESYELRRIEVHPHELQRFASCGELALEPDRMRHLVLNEYVLLCAGERKTIPARLVTGGLFRHLRIPEVIHAPRGASIKPMNLGQQCFLDALLDPDIALVTCYGQAGTGKTLLAVAAGLHMVLGKQFNGMTVSRPVVAMGDTLGFLPGTLDEKMRPWLQPIYDALDLLMPMTGMHPENEHTFKKSGKKPKYETAHTPSPPAAKRPYDHMLEQGIIEIEALCYIRGRSIPRRFFVLDEAQQLTPLEAKTVITRMSKGSKLVLIGDPAQIDNPYVDSRSNGLVYTRNRMKNQALTAHVSLSKGERSPLAEISAQLM